MDNESPSQPYIDIEISDTLNANPRQMIGEIDTGSYITVIPERLVILLDLKRTGDTTAAGFDKKTPKPYCTYVVNIKINGALFEMVQVISAQIEYALIGRDLINLWRMTMDGQSRTGELEPWSTDTQKST